MRRRRQPEPAPWDGVARYHDGTPIDVVKRRYLDAEMRLYDSLPKKVRKRLQEEGGFVQEEVPQMTGLG